MRKHVRHRLERLLADMERLALPLPEAGREERMARGRVDDEFFFLTYLPHIFALPAAEFHRDLCALYDLRGSPAVCAVHAPRGFGKTPILSQGKPIQSLCYGLHAEMLAVSATADIADELTAPIAQELRQNPRILQDFGPLITTGGATRFETALGGKFWAVGRRQSIRGYHPDLAIFDDIEDDKQAYNGDRVRELIEWADKVVVPAMKPASAGGSNLIWSGTIICTDSALDVMLHRESLPAERRRIYRALNEAADGTLSSLWEARRSVPDLLGVRALIGDRAFDSEFQGAPHDDERIFPPEAFLGFQEAEFQRVAAEGPTIDLSFYDPAARDTVKHDFKAIVFGSRAANGLTYVRDAWIQRLSVDAVVDKTYAHHHEHPTAEQWFETNGFQVLYRTVFEMKAMLQYGGEMLDLHEYTTTMNKDMMIEGLSGFVNTGRIRFKQNPDGSWYGDIGVLIKQLMDFPRGKKKDGADALSKVHALLTDKARKPAFGQGNGNDAPRRGRLRRFFDAVVRP